jgi:hypothetical protein
MPIYESFRHTPGLSASDKLAHLQVLRAGTSPFADEPKAQPQDTSRAVTCKVEGCHRRFLNEAYLERHQADRHAPRPKPTKAAEIEAAAAVERVIETITARITSGEMRAGHSLSISGLAAELGVTRGRAEAAIEQLVRTGRLGYAGVGYARRCVVVG